MYYIVFMLFLVEKQSLKELMAIFNTFTTKQLRNKSGYLGTKFTLHNVI